MKAGSVTSTLRHSTASPFAGMLRAAFVPTMLAGALTVLGYWLAQGRAAGASALLGYAVAVAFFTLGLLVMRSTGRPAEPLLLLATAMAVFLGQTIFVLAVILALRNASWLDGAAFGLTILVVAIVWQVLQVLVFRRARRPVYDQPVHDGRAQQ